MTNWFNSAGPLTGDENNVDWSGFTIRQLIASAQISYTGLTYVRVTFESSGAQALTIDKAYIGHAATSGDPYDFESTPTQLLFSTSAGFAINAGTQKVSDTLTFSVQASKNLIVAFHVSGDATHDDVRAKATQTGWTAYYKTSVDEAATVNVTGYSTSAKAALAIMRIEAGTDSGTVIWF